jgi:hypothetical protein
MVPGTALDWAWVGSAWSARAAASARTSRVVFRCVVLGLCVSVEVFGYWVSVEMELAFWRRKVPVRVTGFRERPVRVSE